MASLFPSMIAAFSTSNLDDDLDFCDVTGAGVSENGVTAGADVSNIHNPAFAARSAPTSGAHRFFMISEQYIYELSLHALLVWYVCEFPIH
jgi:hypothetical protein